MEERAVTELELQTRPIAGAMPAWSRHARRRGTARRMRENRARQARLVALWGSDESARGGGYALHLALALRSGCCG